ncbi:MAG: hypothetical protein ACI3Y5_09550 [Prevotella sp.]
MNKKIYTAPTFEPFTTEELMEDIKIVGASGAPATVDETLSKKNNIDMEFEEEEPSNPHYKNYWDLNN